MTSPSSSGRPARPSATCMPHSSVMTRSSASSTGQPRDSATLVRNEAEDLGLGHPRADAVGPDALGSVRLGHVLGEVGHPRLQSGVGKLVRLGGADGDRRRRHDRPAPAIDEHRDSSPTRPHGGQQHVVEGGQPVFVRATEQIALAAHAQARRDRDPRSRPLSASTASATTASAAPGRVRSAVRPVTGASAPADSSAAAASTRSRPRPTMASECPVRDQRRRRRLAHSRRTTEHEVARPRTPRSISGRPGRSRPGPPGRPLLPRCSRVCRWRGGAPRSIRRRPGAP